MFEIKKYAVRKGGRKEIYKFGAGQVCGLVGSSIIYTRAEEVQIFCLNPLCIHVVLVRGGADLQVSFTQKENI